MEVTIVTTTAEREEMRRTLAGHAKVAADEITSDEFRDNYPNKVWIDTELCTLHNVAKPFLVVDNREGECFCKDFATLDGAILYATDVYMTAADRKGWDYMGSIRDGGDLRYRLEEGDAAPQEEAP